MLTAKIIITVQYPEGIGMEDAEDDKAEFLQEIETRNFPTVTTDGIKVEYTIAEVVEPTHSQNRNDDVCSLCAPRRCFGHP